MGRDLTSNAHFLVLQGDRFDDALVDEIVRLKGIEGIDFQDARITDAGVARLAALPLTRLDIKNCPITDAALADIGRMGTLTDLSLYDAPITDQGMAHIAQLSHLKSLILLNIDLGDPGLEAVLALPLEFFTHYVAVIMPRTPG